MSDQPFADQHIVVTGGGTGIGRATALAFANLGAASVIITGRRANRLAEVAALQPNVVPVAADVTTEAGAEAVAAAVKERGGRLDVLVHNAGIYRQTPCGGTDMALARELLEVNVLGPVQLNEKLLPLLRSPGGSIVFVSSVGGSKPEPYAGVYAASKAAADSLTRTWAMELSKLGIRVNAVAPAAVRTEVYETNGLSEPEIDGLFQFYAAANPLKRTGTVDDVTPWIIQLADPNNSWITGQVIIIDGGAHLTTAADSPFSPFKWDPNSEESSSWG